MWKFVSFVTEATTKHHLFEYIALVTKHNVEVTKLEPNIQLIILFLLKKTATQIIFARSDAIITLFM